MPTHFRTALLIGAAAFFLSVHGLFAQDAQAPPAGPSQLEVSITYGATASSAVGGSTFWMQGGSAQIHGRVYGGWGLVADVAGAHAANISSSGVGLDMITATFGPRYTWFPAHARYQFFGQGMVGIADGFNSVFPNSAGVQTVANSLAVKTGGGINFNLTPHLALRGFEIDYLRTQMPNAANNAQNNLQINSGFVLRFR
jgi:hypothetical protein